MSSEHRNPNSCQFYRDAARQWFYLAETDRLTRRNTIGAGETV